MKLAFSTGHEGWLDPSRYAECNGIRSSEQSDG